MYSRKTRKTEGTAMRHAIKLILALIYITIIPGPIMVKIEWKKDKDKNQIFQYGILDYRGKIMSSRTEFHSLKEAMKALKSWGEEATFAGRVVAFYLRNIQGLPAGE